MTEGIYVPPKSRKYFRSFANELRRTLKIGEYLPILQILETILPQYFSYDDYIFEVIEPHQMGDCHGKTGKNFIFLREDVYDGLCSGNGRDRFTAAHELAHFIFHRGELDTLNRRRCTDQTKPYLNSEWQADTFASEILMPADLFQNYGSLDEIMKAFGVSYSAAKTRNNILFKDGLIKRSLC